MTTDEPAPSKTRMSFAMIGLATVGLAIPTCVIAGSFRQCAGTTSRGSISLTGGGPAWTSVLGTCTADPTSLAVELSNAGSPTLVRATLDPLDGPLLEIAAPGRPIAKVTRAICPSLRVDVRRAGSRADGSQMLSGAAAASCLLPSGVQLELDAWWRDCHQRDPD